MERFFGTNISIMAISYYNVPVRKIFFTVSFGGFYNFVESAGRLSNQLKELFNRIHPVKIDRLIRSIDVYCGGRNMAACNPLLRPHPFSF
jgi:hypothetical protein